MARTSGSSAFSTVQPDGRVTRATTDLTSARSSTVCTPSRPRWSALMLVTTETSLTAVPMPRNRIPPRAVSVTATVIRGSARTRPAPPGPDQSPLSTSSPSRNTPSVDDQPGTWPAAFIRWAMSRVVVVLPFVPVTAITGIDGLSAVTASPGSIPASADRTSASSGRSPACPAVNRPKVRATAAARASAVPRCTKGKATTVVSPSPGRATAATRRPMAAPHRRTRVAAKSATAARRAGDSGRPTAASAILSARCQPTTVPESAASAGPASSVSFTVGRGK